METNNIFDHMERDIDDLSEQTIIEDTGVNTENVRVIFMKKVNADKTTTAAKKHNKKKVLIVLAAAVAATLAVGTVTAGAMGSFNSVFGEHFAGEKVNGIYSGGNIHIETDPLYEAELLGVAGDRYDAVAAVSFKRADGKNFADTTDGYYVEPICINSANDGVIISDDKEEYGVKLTAFQELQHRFEGVNINEYAFSSYKLTSPDTIKGIYNIKRDTYELTGQKMEVAVTNLYLMHDVSDIDTLDIVFSENGIDELELDKNRAAVEQKIKEASQSLGENQIVHRTVECKENENGTLVVTMKFTVTDYEKLNVQLKGSWNLNYKPNEIKKEAVEDTFSYQGVDYQVSDIEAGAFDTRITLNITNGAVSSDNQNAEYADSWESGIASQEMKVTLTNGEVLEGFTSFPYAANGSGSENQVVVSMMYVRDNDWISVNPEEVVSIEFAGNVITK